MWYHIGRFRDYRKTSLDESSRVRSKLLTSEAVGTRNSDDIVQSLQKCKAVIKQTFMVAIVYLPYINIRSNYGNYKRLRN